MVYAASWGSRVDPGSAEEWSGETLERPASTVFFLDDFYFQQLRVLAMQTADSSLRVVIEIGHPFTLLCSEGAKEMVYRLLSR